MKIESFEQIESWKEARGLVRDIYASLQQCKDFGFKDQIQRAAVSIMSNIAEGFERGTNKEFIHFLTIARGSLAEVKSLSYAAFDVGYIDELQHMSLLQECNKLGNLINGFLKYLRNTTRKK